ncbi:MAG: hypothetical protein A3G49_00335 [Candidatus Sungbacteria bacterium RIFCSPLOWO2_12_FULL_41_11]|uniref:Uncharacterized protein n=1 Tax=Candidatus Sungbacteria bacterium RIFCSPLOWO2_12_FULL_41_11 TaxID=1802286 RepID=A0A1G2LPS3_9BACT|nr:MAG: hypothetical protein A3G49_00335 [Candidatus Sungbacteria bacterium RIFCSPLOWO2_12_FULL_41_11]
MYESTATYEPVEEVKSEGEGRGLAKKIARWFLYFLIFLTPVFFLTYASPVWFGKQIFVYVLGGLAFIAWLVDFLTSGKISYRKSFLNVVIFLLLLVFLLSTFYSLSFYESLWGSDSTGEKLSSFIVFAVLFLLVGSVFKEEDGVKLGLAIFAGSILVGVFSLLQVFGIRLFSGDFAQTFDFNPVGTINSLAVFYGLVLSVGIGVLSHFKEMPESRHKKYFFWAVLLSSAVLFLNLFLIVSFKLVWLGLSLAMVILLSLSVRVSARAEEQNAIKRFGGLSFYLPLILLVVSALFYISNFQLNFMDSLTGGPNAPSRWSSRFPAEVSPNMRATFNIGKQVLAENPILGTGPATFIYDYSLYRDPVLNFDRIFWAVKFFHGSALGTTLLSTTGILGFGAFLLFVLLAVVAVLKNTLSSQRAEALRFGIASAVVYGSFMWFMYPPTFTTTLYMFLLLGIFAALSVYESWGILGFGMRTITSSSASTMFVGSLISIFLIVGSVVGMYYSFQKYIAESYYSEGIRILSQTTDTDKPLVEFANAAFIDPKDDKYARLQGQVYYFRLRNLIQGQLPSPTSPTFVQDFQTNFISAYQAIQQAQRLNPNEISNWSLLGLICETVIQVNPLICSEKFLTGTYEDAIKYDPISPSAHLDAGRAWLLTADILALRAGQSQGKEEADSLQSERETAINKAVTHLEKSASLKPDFASSHFLLAQAYVRQNNLQGAIKKLEDTKAVTIGDVGVLFQLGLLYYQANQIDKAQAEFEQAVRLNDNYSNARYFLGLIYDQKGDKPGALEQFRKIQALNPDNTEVRLIIANLESGKPALSQVVPPLPAPETRKEPPVK